MKCLTVLACIIVATVAIGPVEAQVTPATPATPPRAETTPRAARAPRAPQDVQRLRDDELQAELEQRQRAMQDAQLKGQREMEEHQRELMALQLDRQREMEERQRALQEAQLDRQREQEERLRERMLDQELTTPRVKSFDFVEPTPPLAPTPALAPRASSDAAMVPESLDGAFLNQRPPAPWAHSDPADSLYRVAREALNRGDYRRAAQLFSDVARRYPNSNYAYVSTYYEAFSRYRIGTTEELMAADRALRTIAESSSTVRAWGASNTRTWGRSDNTDVEGLRTRIRGALAMRGDDRAADDVERRARAAGSSCDQEDLMVRIEALNALSQMDANAAMPILRRVLDRREDCLVDLRRRAIFMLARRGDAEATSALIGAAKNDPSPTVRAEAVTYLPRMPGDAGLAALEDVLRTSDDERIQRAAVRALMSSDSPAARTSLRGLLERRDASETLRLQVLEAYSKDRSTPEDAAYLRSLYRNSDSERMKMAIIGAIARIGGKDNQDWLTGIVRNTTESSQIRSAALQRLSRSDMPITDIGRLYDAADSRSMREQLLSALASRKEPEATDKLIEVARNSTDLEMRRMAINYLSRKDDPRAKKLLMELIEK
ncbi:MAG TPA: HEAT repeat domain-containing protein [Gemmatimonadaceae bacterium]|nr:HEAT repeat domain-containing protein [Gemmatimonadaceae bacterium]